jgi:hypothetical protein
MFFTDSNGRFKLAFEHASEEIQQALDASRASRRE